MSGSDLPKLNNKFVSEDEIAEAKKKRQEEWERVRKPEQPVEAPEEEFDPRTLYEKLEANKTKKQEEWDEAHRMKNMVKGLENDEIEFLESVSRQQVELENQKQLEEKLIIAEYKMSQVVDLTQQQDLASSSKSAAKKPLKGSGKTQKELLAGVVRRKSGEGSAPKKPKLENEAAGRSDSRNESADRINPSHSETSDLKTSTNPYDTRSVVSILPGIGTYSDTSSSDDGMDGENVNDPFGGHLDTSSSSSGIEEGIPFPTKPKVVIVSSNSTRD